MAERIRLGAIVAALFAITQLAPIAFAGAWDAQTSLQLAAVATIVAAFVAHGRFGQVRSFGWNVAWLGATSAVAIRALGGGAGGHLVSLVDTPDLPSAALASAVLVAGTAGLAASLWLMIRERLEITFATDFLAEGLLIGSVLAFTFAISGASLTRPGGRLEAGSLIDLLPLVFVVAALWTILRLTRLTSEAPAAYRWLSVAVGLFVLAAILNAINHRGLSTQDSARSVILTIEVVATFIWIGASLDRSLARPFDPVPVPDRAATAHVPLLIVVGAIGPLMVAYGLLRIPMAGREPLLTPTLDMHPLMLVFGAVVLPLATAAQLIRRVHIEYTVVARDHTDALTGLADSAFFHQAVAEALDHAGRTPAVLYLDLDRFKAINDSLGHAVGDELLREVGRRLSRAVPDDALAGRLGGDEFAILLPDAKGSRSAFELAEEVIAVFAERHRIDERDLFVGTSIGIALGTKGGIDAERLIKNADVAMYRAKRRRDRKIVLYSSGLDLQANLRLRLENELRKAVESNAFELHYQPKVDAVTHRVVGYEALLRWRHPKLGTLSPDAFLPVAEETGLVRAIGDWVLFEACRVLNQWRAAGERMLPIAVNISPRQLAGTDLFQLVSRALERSGADPHHLEVELTESTLLEGLEAVAESVVRLRQLGVKVSLDDFGTGYSALSYLQEITFDWIKLDRAFVRTVEQDDRPQPVVSGVLAMAEQLGTPVVAEGVETAGQARWLAERGAQVLQGYLFGRPEKLAPARQVEASGSRNRFSPTLLAVGLDIHRMRRILARIAADEDVTGEASDHELKLLADALQTDGRSRRIRPPGTRQGLRERFGRGTGDVPEHPVIRPVPEAAPTAWPRPPARRPAPPSTEVVVTPPSTPPPTPTSPAPPGSGTSEVPGRGRNPVTPLTRRQLSGGPRAVTSPTPPHSSPLDLGDATPGGERPDGRPDLRAVDPIDDAG